MSEDPDLTSVRTALERALARSSRNATGFLNRLAAAILQPGRGTGPVITAAMLTRERIRATRTLGSDAGDLLDAVLVARLLETCEEPRREDLVRAWGPFLESRAQGGYAPNPAVHRPRLPAASPALRILHASMRAYFRVGLLWCERTGVPRRWLVDAGARDRVRIARYLATRLGGLRPVWATHLPRPRAGVHLTEEEFVRSHLEIARALRRVRAIRGVASASWYYDPVIGAVSPSLGFILRILSEGGCLIFEVPIDDAMRENALRCARHRRLAHRRGEYEPRAFARLWGRSALLAWAARQPGWQLTLPIREPFSLRLFRAQG